MALGHDLAERIARSNVYYPKWRMGAVVIKGGSVRSVGWNTIRNDPAYVPSGTNCSVHAEIAALRPLRYRARGCSMYIARITRSGHLAMALPCANCQTVIEDAGIRKVFYTNMEGRWVQW